MNFFLLLLTSQNARFQRCRKKKVSVCQSEFDVLWSRDISVYHLVTQHHIGHFQKYYITLCLSSKTLHKHCSIFSRDLQWSQEKIKTMLIQNFGGQTKSIMVFLKVAHFLSNKILIFKKV